MHFRQYKWGNAIGIVDAAPFRNFDRMEHAQDDTHVGNPYAEILFCPEVNNQSVRFAPGVFLDCRSKTRSDFRRIGLAAPKPDDGANGIISLLRKLSG